MEVNLQAPGGDSFPTTVFTEGKQDAIMGYLLTNAQFFSQAIDRISAGWFVNPTNGKLWDATVTLYRTYKRKPTVEEVRDCKQFMLEDARERNRLQAQIAAALHNTTLYGLDTIRPDLTEWMHARLFKSGVEASSQLYNKAVGQKDGRGKTELLDRAYRIMKDTMRTVETTSFEEDNEERFDDYERQFGEAEVEYENALSFGYRIFDQQLTPLAKSGSLLRGDTTILLAPTNAGKTTCMITVAMHNIKAGKNVLFFTHEGRPEDIKQKMWCSFLDISPALLFKLYKTAEGRSILDKALAFIQRHLTYIPLNKAGLTVEQVAAVIRKKQEALMAQNTGRGYDLLVDDYPAKLTVPGMSNGKLSRREKDDESYNYFVNLGLEYKFHVLCAIQTNREGSKVNAGIGGADRLLRMEDVMESWGPMTAATNVISINRDPAAEAKGRVTFYICKSRSSEKGVAVVCRSNYSHSITHSNDLGGAWYRGETTMADKIDTLLSQHRDSYIDPITIATA
jgi:replicative DNA helicase